MMIGDSSPVRQHPYAYECVVVHRMDNGHDPNLSKTALRTDGDHHLALSMAFVYVLHCFRRLLQWIVSIYDRAQLAGSDQLQDEFQILHVGFRGESTYFPVAQRHERSQEKRGEYLLQGSSHHDGNSIGSEYTLIGWERVITIDGDDPGETAITGGDILERVIDHFAGSQVAH